MAPIQLSTKALQVIITAKASNGKTGTLKLALTEKPKVTPTFTVSSLKPELIGNPGGTVSYLVKLEGKDKFADTVTLFATDLPKGVQADFDPKEVTLSAEDALKTSQVTLTVEKDIECQGLRNNPSSH